MITLGLIGLGAMGRRHLDALDGRDDVRLVAIADPRSDAIAQAQPLIGPTASQPAPFADGATLLDTAGIQAVIVATPPQTHAALCCAAIAAGIAVLVEKPLAGTVEDGRSIVDCATRGHVIVQVGHIERFNPAVEALEECLRDDLIGRIRSVQAVRMGTPLARRDDVGVTFDLAIHDLDLICHLLDDGPSAVAATVERAGRSEHEDVVRGELVFSSGASATIEASWRASTRERRIMVVGERGMLEADLLSREVSFTPSDARVKERVAVAAGDSLRLEQDAFISAVQKRGASPVSARDGLRAVALAKLMLESAAVGRSVDV